MQGDSTQCVIGMKIVSEIVLEMTVVSLIWPPIYNTDLLALSRFKEKFPFCCYMVCDTRCFQTPCYKIVVCLKSAGSPKGSFCGFCSHVVASWFRLWNVILILDVASHLRRHGRPLLSLLWSWRLSSRQSKSSLQASDHSQVSKECFLFHEIFVCAALAILLHSCAFFFFYCCFQGILLVDANPYLYFCLVTLCLWFDFLCCVCSLNAFACRHGFVRYGTCSCLGSA